MSLNLVHSDAVTKLTVKVLRAHGVRVEYFITPTGVKGAPDLVAGYAGQTWLIEMKKPGADLDEDQKKWWAAWNGGPLVLAHSYAEALAALGIEPDAEALAAVGL